ncbi:Cobalt-zinc-cadmium resistance protein CzcA (plasmid) [Variovorax sp. WDL1]|nr:Cobalt-zinc-cadmium resistance protein CzcA [Variovorax sp. WDL1]
MRSRPNSPLHRRPLPKGSRCSQSTTHRTGQEALNTAESSLLEGAILVAIILFLFLGEFRSAIVVVITLPMAMLIASS